MIKTISYPIDVINHTFDVFPVKYPRVAQANG